MDESHFSEPTRRWLASGRHLEIEGKRIFVYERGSGPVIHMLHGFPTSGYDWRGVIEGLASAYRCAALDFPGYGLSDKPAAYSYSLVQQTDIVEGLTKALELEEAHVVSHDVGTSVHTELLAREQEGQLPFRIRSSTFLNGSMLQDLATITPFQKLLASNETLPQAMAISGNLTANYIDGLKSVMKRPESLSEDDIVVMNDLIAYQEGNRRLPALSLHARALYPPRPLDRCAEGRVFGAVHLGGRRPGGKRRDGTRTREGSPAGEIHGTRRPRALSADRGPGGRRGPDQRIHRVGATSSRPRPLPSDPG